MDYYIGFAIGFILPVALPIAIGVMFYKVFRRWLRMLENDNKVIGVWEYDPNLGRLRMENFNFNQIITIYEDENGKFDFDNIIIEYGEEC